MKPRFETLRYIVPVVFVALALCLPATAWAGANDPFGIQVERQPAILLSDSGEEVGTAQYWNRRNDFVLLLYVKDGWHATDVQIFVGRDLPPTKKDKVDISKFPCKRDVAPTEDFAIVTCSLRDDFDLSWGGSKDRNVSIHGDIMSNDGEMTDSFWVKVPYEDGEGLNMPISDAAKGSYFIAQFFHPRRGHFIDSPVAGVRFETSTHWGLTDEAGAFDYFPGERVKLWVGTLFLGESGTDRKISPMDIFMTDVGDPQVVNMARLLQSLDADGEPKPKIDIKPSVAGCLDMALEVLGLDGGSVNFADTGLIDAVIAETLNQCAGNPEATLVEVSAQEAQAHLENSISVSGIYRKNISKTAEWSEGNQKLEVMPVYFPGVRSNGDPSYCDINTNGIFDEGEEGVPYEEWRLNGDPDAEECDPRVDGDACVVTLIECREVAKPLVVGYLEQIDIFDDKVTTEFYADRFAHDFYVAVSRDDGATWKRMNVSRMADLSSFTLETGEPFPGTVRSPQLKVNDNQILAVWTSTFARGGNPRYAINLCDDPETEAVESLETGCAIYCRGDAENGTEVCEPDYPYDDDYYVTDIWGVRGQQRSVNYDEVDDVADLGIGEIPYSALWAARGVIVTQKDLNEGVFAYLIPEDDPDTEENESAVLQVGDIVWFKPERLTSARRDAFIPVIGSARGSGFAIAWQEDPEGLRPGKGKGPGQGWSGAISNHKTDIWYTFISFEDFSRVDANFVPGGPPEGGGPDDKPGLGRPKALVPFSLPTRISDNDMVNTDTLKVELDGDGLPALVDGTYTPIDPLTVEHGNAVGTKRYAYMARAIDEYDNEDGIYVPGGDGIADYQYYMDGGGTLDLCATDYSVPGSTDVLTELPGTTQHERWYQFVNNEGSEKTVCIASDGRLIDGDVSASRPNIQLQPYTKSDGTKSAWVLLAYEESKGMGHSLAASEHDSEIVDDSGQDKPVKQDFGKNVIYHSFDFTQPDLVSAGHIVNLPALCGGLYPNYCGEAYDGTNPTCTCEPGQPIPLYFEDQEDGTWVPNEAEFLQFRTEIARRARFFSQSPGKMGPSGTVANIIYKQGQEGQGRPADVFIRRIVKSGSGNPYKFENFECTTYLDQSFDLPACQNGAGDKDSAVGYMCNVWGEASGDRLCGGINENGDYPRRDHINLTSTNIDLKVDAGPEDDTPDDPTDDVYGTEKVLLWSQYPENLGDESYGVEDTSVCDLESCAGMYSNARSHRGFIRGDFVVAAYAWSPNWAAARNGNDRYNFYLRKSFDGGQTWTTTPADLGGEGVYYCQEWRSDPTTPDDDGSGNAPPVYDGFDPDCVSWCPPDDTECAITGIPIGPGEFQPAIKVSEFDNNKETSSDPRVGATPPTYPLDGRDPALPELRLVEDEYVDNVFFVAWGAGENVKSTGGQTVTPEAPPTDAFYTRSTDYGDTFLKVPWVVGGANSNLGYGETVWRYERLAWGDPEQGECQIRATSDGSKMYAIYHQMTPEDGDPDEPITRWYPWEPEESYDNDVWFRRVIFWPEDELGLPPIEDFAVAAVFGPMSTQLYLPSALSGHYQSVKVAAESTTMPQSFPPEDAGELRVLLPTLMQD